jgi:CheY-like chemotaxis protein
MEGSVLSACGNEVRMFSVCSPRVKAGLSTSAHFLHFNEPEKVPRQRFHMNRIAKAPSPHAVGTNPLPRHLVQKGVGSERMGLSTAGRPVVLIVEDEFLLRMNAVDMIKAAGFEAVEAANADEAIGILETRRDITVVFTDIQMPGSMDGLKLARAVRGRWPPIKIVATSGLVDVAETDLPEGGRFLAKPYSPQQLAGLLRELTE